MEPIFASLIAASATGRLLAKKARVGLLILAVGFLATVMLMPGAGNAQDARIAKSMAALKDQTAKLGAPKIDGTDPVGGKDAPALYFGSTKMNNNFTVVDEVAKEDGQGMAATLFVKGGDEYIRAATNVPKPDGSGRAIGTILAGPALESIKMGKAYYGKAPILGTPYVTGYEPIKDASGAIIGIYFVGYSQDDLQAKVEGRLAYAKTLLGITDSQAAAWKAYEDVSRTNVQSIRAAHTGHDDRGTIGLGHRPHACSDRHGAGAARCDEGIAAGDGGPLQRPDARPTGESRRCALAARQQRRR